MEDNFKVYIYREWDDAVRIAFVVTRNGIRHIAKPVDLIFTPMNEEAENPPTLKLSSGNAGNFFSAFAEALDKQGIKTENDFKIQGKLEAKESHLQDMRRLVFKNQQP